MSLRQELIQLYGAGKASDIKNSPDFEQISSKYGAVEGFGAELLRIHKFKKRLEDLCCGQTFTAQVRLCLRLLSGEKNKEDLTDYHDLIMRAYWVHWSDPQKEHFDKAYIILKGDVYFFLSFTTRDVSKVNHENRYFIEDVFYADVVSQKFSKRDLTKENMLAEAIWKYLKGQGLSGFYYPEHEGMSTPVKQKLQNNLNKALTFVQLVEGVMFDYKDPNFCHFEYEKALESKACCKRIYVLGETRADIGARKYMISSNWLPWFNEIVNDVDALELVSTRYRDDDAVRNNHEALKDKIVRQIEHIRDEMFEKIPA